MWFEILLFRRYLVAIHYFYIYAKQRSKWNSGEINYSYLLNKWFVTQAQCMIMVYKNVLQFDVCSNCYLLVFWLPTYWEIYEMQYFGYLSVRRYNLVNFFSTAYPVVFQMPQLMPHGMCQIPACCSGVLSLHFTHRALESWDTSTMPMLI